MYLKDTHLPINFRNSFTVTHVVQVFKINMGIFCYIYAISIDIHLILTVILVLLHSLRDTLQFGPIIEQLD